jgi:hypothetical protein
MAKTLLTADDSASLRLTVRLRQEPYGVNAIESSPKLLKQKIASAHQAASDAFARHPVAVAAGIVVIAAYLNTVAFGFEYGAGNHCFELPFVNWMQHPWLYPNDLLRQMFSNFPTAFWLTVFAMGRWFGVYGAVWTMFVLTKLIFFTGIVGVLRKCVRSSLLAAVIAFGFALSPFLNGYTPFGASNMLDTTETQTSFAVALLVCASWLLLEKKWLGVALLLGISIFVNCAFASFFALPLLAFAFLDWRTCQKSIVAAGVVVATAGISFLLVFAHKVPSGFTPDYIQIVMWRDPLHWSLLSHPRSELLRGFAVLAAAIAAVAVARKQNVERQVRLELLALSFGAHVAFGAIAGQFFLNRIVVLAQPLRADSFFFPLAMLVIEVYAANVLVECFERRRAAIWAFGIVGLLFPLFGYRGLVLLYFGCAAIALFPRLAHGQLSMEPSHAGSKWVVVAIPLVPGMAWAFWRWPWSPVRVALLLALAVFVLLIHPRRTWPVERMAACVMGLALALTMWRMVPNVRRLWHPANPSKPVEAAWRDVQGWAKANTSVDSAFLVPPWQLGFRTFSERTSWVDWKDGAAVAFDPPISAEWLRRLNAIGAGPEIGKDCWQSMMQYRQQPWEKLNAVALANGVRYIVQARDVYYPKHPIFANKYFVVYDTQL